MSQPLEALALATRTREERRVVKEELRRRQTTLREALEIPCMQTMEIRKLLECLPGIRKAKSQKLCRTLCVYPSSKVQNLSDSRRRQLEELVG